MNLAPVVLFVYNRPWHAEQTLHALQANTLANQSDLYIYCDGAKPNAALEDLKKIEAVRALVTSQEWCKTVTIIENEHNLGLANSVIQGVTEVIEKHGSVIVLEDDIVTGTYFLQFMNDGLNLYKEEQQVFGVSGYRFPSSKTIKQPTYFLPIMSSWGYATWADRWHKINFNGEDCLKEVQSKKIYEKLDFGNIKYYQMLKDQTLGRNDSWAVRFYTSMFLQKGLFLYPNQTLVQNIGFDGTGVHCEKVVIEDQKNEMFSKDIYIKVEKEPVLLDDKVVHLIEESLKGKNKVEKKLKKKRNLSNFIAPELKSFIKRKIGLDDKRHKKDFYEDLKAVPRYTQTKVELEGYQIIVPDCASFLFMHNEIFKDRIYQFQTKNDNPYIIDGGANIGLASIYFKLLYPSATIVAFEPDTVIYNILKNNIESFKFEGIELVNKGLWDEETQLSFKSEGADAGLLEAVDHTLKPSSMVLVESLKPYLQKHVDFLKLDIEGAETVVLKDIVEELKNVERIFVEYHSFVGQEQRLNEVIDILSSAKFRLYMSIPGDNSIKSPFMGLKTYNNMDFQLNIFGFKDFNNL